GAGHDKRSISNEGIGSYINGFYDLDIRLQVLVEPFQHPRYRIVVRQNDDFLRNNNFITNGYQGIIGAVKIAISGNIPRLPFDLYANPPQEGEDSPSVDKFEI